MIADEAADSAGEERRRLGIAVVMASAVTVGLTIGMTIPLISLSMTAAGAGATLVGGNGAMPALAVLLTAPLAPRLIRILGMVATTVLGCTVSALALALFPFFDSLTAWFVLRLAMGFGLALQWVVSETWLNRVASSAGRGRAVALYATMWSGGLAAGPLVLQVTGIEGVRPFAAAAGLILLAALPPLLGRRGAPAGATGSALTGGGGWSLALFSRAPTVILALFSAGFVEISLFTLLPLYGQTAGLDRSSAVLMVSVLAAGGLVWQLPLGWLADKAGPRPVLAAAALISVLAAVALDLTASGAWLLWPVLFLWGGAMSGFYTLGLTQIGHLFGPADMAHANALVIMAYTVGTIAGPAVSGAALDLWPVHGLPLVAGLVYCLYLAAGCREALK